MAPMGTRLVIKSHGQVLFLNAANVDRIEAAGYYARLHVGRDTHIMRRTLLELERDLGEDRAGATTALAAELGVGPSLGENSPLKPLR
jgi:hypothetical protein